MTTEKLYLKEMYARETEATVIEVSGNQIILDRTVMYAESGGQLGDTGYIDSLKVVDAQKKITPETRMLTHPDFPPINVNMDVVHYLDQPEQSLSVGDKVTVTIDWERRYAIMKLHSATHVAWHFILEALGDLPLKGCLIGPEKARLDFGAKVDPDALPEIAATVNRFIGRSHPIKNITLDEEPEALVWKCETITIPCGGTHVRNTSEIGTIKLKRRSQGKKLDRVYVSLE
jgi:alanyl-tRNA synthetase